MAALQNTGRISFPNNFPSVQPNLTDSPGDCMGYIKQGLWIKRRVLMSGRGGMSNTEDPDEMISEVRGKLGEGGGTEVIGNEWFKE